MDEVLQILQDRALFAGILLALDETLPKHITDTLLQSDQYVKAVARAKELLNG